MSEYWSDILNHPVDKLAVVELTEFRLLDANAEFCSYFGHNRSELINKSFISFISHDTTSGLLAVWNETLETSGFVKYHDKVHGRIIQIQRVIHERKPHGFVRVFDIATNKKVIEQELADSERRFKTLSDVTSEGVAFVQDGKLIDANDQLSRIFSYDDSREIINKKLAEFIAVTDIQRIMASAEISVTNRNEVRAMDRNGRPIFLEITGSYLAYQNLRTLVLVFDDISIRKRAEQALQQSLVSFQRLLEDSPNGVIILTDGKIQYLNQAACTLLAVKDEDEVFGDSFVDFIDDEFKSTVLVDIQKIRDGEEVEDKEIRIQNTYKEVIDVEIKSTLTVYENKPSIQITLNNITARNQLIQEQIRVRFVEEINSALKAEIEEHRATQIKLEKQQRQTLEQTAKIESIFNSTENIMMWTIKANHEITAMNTNFMKSMKQTFGEDVNIGDNILEVIQKHLDHNFYQGQMQAFTNGFKGRPQQFELPLLDHEGATVWWQSFLNPVYLHGELEELSCLVYDNTERKQIDRKIRDSLKEKEVLLQEVHHRVKNNLQVISSILNLQSSYVDDPKTLEILRESQQRIKSMSFIHETIYRTADFSRLEFMDYIKTIASNLIQSYRTAGVLVDFKTEMESVGLNLDQAIPCGLIINELVSNALKYAFKGRKKGVLTIVLREENNEVYIAVKDDGVGLPKDFAYEKNNSLGIQLVYALLDQLDATVNINQSNGTEFLIHFQRKQ
jgi:PAS domain S-box-containing protein